MSVQRAEDTVRDIIRERFDEIEETVRDILCLKLGNLPQGLHWPDTSVDLDALMKSLSGPTRGLKPDPGNPGGCDPFGGWEWPPDTRWETDAEFRERLKEQLR